MKLLETSKLYRIFLLASVTTETNSCRNFPFIIDQFCEETYPYRSEIYRLLLVFISTYTGGTNFCTVSLSIIAEF
jgi:hypothetical protein